MDDTAAKCPDQKALETHEESNLEPDILEILPWEDILFIKVFPELSLSDLFACRCVSKLWNKCASVYFQYMQKLCLGNYAPKCNSTAFRIITGNSTCLRVLNIRGSKGWINDDLLLSVFQNNPNIHTVDLTNSGHCLQLSLHALTLHCRGLKNLYLRDCHWVLPQNILYLTENCPEVEKIDLTGCWNVTDQSVSLIAKKCTKLKVLSLAKIYGITDTSMSFIGNNSMELELLDIRGCWRITNRGVRLVGEYCRKLRGLLVKDCRDVTEASLLRLRVRGIKIDKPRPSVIGPSNHLSLGVPKLQV